MIRSIATQKKIDIVSADPLLRPGISLGCYPGIGFEEAAFRATILKPRDCLVSQFDTTSLQLCPQNNGVLTEIVIDSVMQEAPQAKLHLHANVRVENHTRSLAQRETSLINLVDFDPEMTFWKRMRELNNHAGGHGYSAHAGLRSHCSQSGEQSIYDLIDRVSRCADFMGCRVAVEGHYPQRELKETGNSLETKYLLSSWKEYEILMASDVDYVIDLSHLNILARQSKYLDVDFVNEMVANPRCLEVHLSENNGTRDSHGPITQPVWWLECLNSIHQDAQVFYEGVQH
jgi:hypothetical protein